MTKYIRLMDGNKSNAGGFEIKIGEEVVANKWNPTAMDPSQMGGFNFSTENKIIRWIHRGDTLYDVELPSDAQVIECQSQNCPHGVFRTNKIIMTNPRKVTKDMVMDFYKKSELPDKTYYQLLVILSVFKDYIEVAKEIVKDRITKENIDDCINEFENYLTGEYNGEWHDFSYDDLNENGKEIYNMLLNIKSKIKLI